MRFTLLITLFLFLPGPASADPSETGSPDKPIQWVVRDWTVFGSLTNALEEPIGGVVLLAGSGPTDRNWESSLLPGENGSGRLLAHSLAKWGFSSIRFDKFGSGETGVSESYSDPDFRLSPADFLSEITGALSAVRVEVGDTPPLFLAGHSEGGLWALDFHRRNPGVFAGVILMGTAGRRQCDVIVDQIDAQLKQLKMSEDTRLLEIARLRNALELASQQQEIPPESLPTLPGLKAVVQAYVQENSADVAAWLCRTDPVQLLPENSENILILQGGLDIQVHPEKDALRLHQNANGSKLVLADEADHVLKNLDLDGQELNRMHAFKYNQAGRSLDPILMRAMHQWLLQHTQ